LFSKEEFATFREQHPNNPVLTSQYDYNQLVEIYNQARTDYIVPMPMNSKRMIQYVQAYDIDLDASIVAVDPDDHEVNGICMLGVRDNRTWITRLGVIPERRRRKSGEFLMRAEIEESLRLGKHSVQLEVIKGNEPAHRLFTKLGFKETRELLVIRRPPGLLDLERLPHMEVSSMPEEHITDYLAKRESGAAWTEETASLSNAGGLKGLIVALPDGELGWVIFQWSPFQLSHFVLPPDVSQKMTACLIAAVHQQSPLQDTKIENVPTNHYSWPIFEQFGYIISFRRIEMLLQL
jgi:ribosomal protein S18 acetylase RimI-like enzyme